ncbi:hypothetical protein [Streptomyces sp. NPDC005181]|uniref:hypothetical protein n=1 Tax=Streptomyces sp. NPDC005181 TaxID=3156869 RepID=UPI0033B8B891
MTRVPRTIPDQDALFDPIRAARHAKTGRQTGDPARAAEYGPATGPGRRQPAVQLVPGTEALRLVEWEQRQLSDGLAAWADLTASTGFPTDR